MKWPTLSESTVECLRAVKRCGGYHVNGRWNAFLPIEGEGPEMYVGNRNALERAGYLRAHMGTLQITELGRDYLFALDCGDAPTPSKTPMQAWRGRGERRVEA